MRCVCVKKGCSRLNLVIRVSLHLSFAWQNNRYLTLTKHHLHDGIILLIRPQSFTFFLSHLNFPIPARLNNKSLNVQKIGKPWRILVVVVKWRHRANCLWWDKLLLSHTTVQSLTCFCVDMSLFSSLVDFKAFSNFPFSAASFSSFFWLSYSKFAQNISFSHSIRSDQFGGLV